MRYKRTIRIASLMLIFLVLWFVGVDKSWFVEDCSDCLYGREILQYRVFTMSIYETVYEYPTSFQLIANDLGKPCPHNNYSRYHKYRWWGLTSFAYPRLPGTTRLGNAAWYTEDIALKVRKMSAENPKLKDEFFQKVILAKKKNTEYTHDFLVKLRLPPKNSDHQ